MGRSNIQLLDHVCLTVSDLPSAQHFYIEVLGLMQHKQFPTWIEINELSSIHLVPIGEPVVPDKSSGTVRHFALQVNDLALMAANLLDANIRVFQMDKLLTRKEVKSTLDDLTFGTGSLFVEDPSGNLVEFMEKGKGIF